MIRAEQTAQPTAAGRAGEGASQLLCRLGQSAPPGAPGGRLCSGLGRALTHRLAPFGPLLAQVEPTSACNYVMRNAIFHDCVSLRPARVIGAGRWAVVRRMLRFKDV